MASVENNYDKYAAEIDSVIAKSEKRAGFGWNLVRVLGELQVLTKASYVTLIIVPLLAGMWPAVAVVVNRYNDSIKTATQKLEIASEKINFFTTDNPNLAILNPDVKNITETLQNEIELLTENIRETSIENPYLPNVWVCAFLSALFAVLGHTVYQIGAPQIIRRSSEREYINEMIDDTHKMDPGIGQKMSLDSTMREVVNEARNKYLYSSKSRILLAGVSMVLYVFAIVMIGVVVYNQTKSVLTAAGWIYT